MPIRNAFGSWPEGVAAYAPWPMYAHWPNITDSLATPAAFTTEANPQWGRGPGAAIQFWGGASGAGADIITFVESQLCISMTPPAGTRNRVFALDYNCNLPDRSLQGSGPVDHARRVMWDSFTLCWHNVGTGTLLGITDFESGLIYAWHPGSGLPLGNNPYWGVLWSATNNQWQWQESSTSQVPSSGIQIDISPWPRAFLEEPVRVDIIHFAATPTSPMIVNLYIQGGLFLSRINDGVSSQLPTVTTTPAATYPRALLAVNQSQAGVTLGDCSRRIGYVDNTFVEATTL